MNTLEREQGLVDRAIAHLRDLGMSLHVDLSQQPGGATGLRHDGVATLTIDGRQLTLPVEVKTGLRPATIGLVAPYVRGGLLISDHITPSVGELLRRREIQYVDGAGNASIRGPGIVVDVRGRRAVTGPSTRERSPLFTRAGLPVVLAILNDPTLLDGPMRSVQEHTTVSLGSVQKVTSFLRTQGYRPTPDDRQSGTWQRLYDGWVAAYLAGARDKTLIGRYSSDRRPRDLAQALDGIAATPSGEAAAYLAGYDIAPTSFDLYVHDAPGPVIRDARLRPDPEGRVVLRESSWTVRAEDVSRSGGAGQRLAPGPVVYADLLAQQDPRTDEIAKEWRGA